MKILFYSPVKLSNGGGCERWHCDVTQSLARQYNHQVEIVTAGLGSDKWSEEYLKTQVGNVPYTCLEGWSIGGLFIPAPKSIYLLWKKMRAVDAVHFIHGFAGQDIVILILKLMTGKSIYAGHHAPIFHKVGFHNWYMANISRRLMNAFDGHMTLNERDRKFLADKWGVRNVHFIPSGIKIDEFLNIRRTRHNRLNFVTVGIYRLQKGFDLLVQAIEEFNRKYPQNRAIFRLVGDGELKDTITTYAKRNPNILDMGYINYERMPGVYKQSDVYLLPSREEPFGLVLIEAWASGMPVMATRTEGPSDMLKEGVNGWFIKDMSATAICEAIEKLHTLWWKVPKNKLFDPRRCQATGLRYGIDTTAERMNHELFSKN